MLRFSIARFFTCCPLVLLGGIVLGAWTTQGGGAFGGGAFAAQPPPAEDAEDTGVSTIVIGTDAQGEPVEIRVDKESMRGVIRGAVGRLRQRLIGESSEQLGLVDDSKWTAADDPNRWVVLVHGFASGTEATKPLMDRLDQPGIRSRRFAYPSDGSIRESSQRLSDALRQVAADYPNRKLTVIAHSMGGLVARNVLESPALDPGNVDQLIMIATPNHGSNLAQFPVGMDVDKLVLRVRQDSLRLVVESALEGAVGSAQVDLRPDSPLFQELNARPRNPDVRYTIFAGTGGPFRPSEAERLEQMAADLNPDSPVAAVVSDQLLTAANSAELIAGQGDGVVSVESAQLPGVQDFVTLPFSHRVLSREIDSDAGRRLVQEITARIVL